MKTAPIQPIATTYRRRRRSLVQDPATTLSVIVIWIFLAIFVLYPLVQIVAKILLTDGRISVAELGNVLRSKYEVRAAWDSVLLGTLVGIFGTGLGFLFAFTAVRANLSSGWSRLLDTAMILPLISPPFTMAITVIFSFGPRGLITHDLLGLSHFNVYGLGSTLFAETITYFPIAYLTLKGILAGIDPNVEDMAFSLGSSRAEVFRRVTVPLSAPGLANAFLLLFAASLADFATPLILAGNSFPVLPTEAFLQITGMQDLKSGAALSFVLLIPSFIVFILQRYWVGRKHYVTITGKAGAQTKYKSVGNVLKWVLLSICVLMSLFILYFYVLLVYASLVLSFGANETFTLSHYRIIFTEGLKAIKDTLIIAGVSMAVGGFYGVVLGYLISTKRFATRKSMEFISMINYSLPGTIVGIAFLIAFNNPPLALTGTAIIIILCNVSRYGAYGTRSTVAILHQIDPSIEEASNSLGASSSLTFRRITIPLVLPALFSSLGIVFIRSMTAISATIFLISVNWTLITVRILENMTELQLGVSAAFSVFVVVVVYIVTIGISIFLRLFKQAGSSEVTSLLGA